MNNYFVDIKEGNYFIFDNFIKDNTDKLIAVANFYKLFAEILPYLDTNKPFNLQGAYALLSYKTLTSPS